MYINKIIPKIPTKTSPLVGIVAWSGDFSKTFSKFLPEGASWW